MFQHTRAPSTICKDALHHPALSKDNEYLAVLSPNQSLYIIALRTGITIAEVILPKSSKTLLSDLLIIRWAPETHLPPSNSNDAEVEDRTAWILLAGGSRLTVVQVTLPTPHAPSSSAVSMNANIFGDYEFEGLYGRIISADFLLSHRQALVTFDTNVHASVVSFSKPQRDDIPSTKFSDARGSVQSPEQLYSTLLLRSKGQDQIVIFALKSGIAEIATTFSPGTTDAQGMKWSPGTDPILAVWDSATYGTKVCFFTALGHPIKQLDVSEDKLSPDSGLNAFGTGVVSIDWKKSNHDSTMLTLGICNAQMLIRVQNHKSLVTEFVALKQHKPYIDGAQTQVWHQVPGSSFESQSGVFEVEVELESVADTAAINANASLVASRLNTLRKAIWIWDLQHDCPSSIMFFNNDVRQVLWHPKIPNALAVFTDEKTSGVYVYHHGVGEPKAVAPFNVVDAESRWTGTWVELQDTTRSPLLVSNKRQFAVGLIENQAGDIILESLLRADSAAPEDEDESSLAYTPSKPGREVKSPIAWESDVNSGVWNVTSLGDKW